MDRLENIRGIVDKLIDKMQSNDERKYAYLHLYGVSQFATMLAINKKVDHELCAIAAMLHDIALYTNNCGYKDHALKSAILAQTILQESETFEEAEIHLIVNMIAKHSDKLQKDDNVYIEILKDADVLTYYLYNPQIPIPEHDKVRLFYLLEFIKNAPTK